MSFAVTVTGFGSFTATVNGEQAVLAAEVHDASALLAMMAAQGPAGPAGPSGVVAATAPIVYTSGTQTVSMDTSYFLRSPLVAGTDGQIVSWDAATSRPLWIDNAARTLFATVRNETGSTLAKGTVVYISGASGNKALVSKAQANNDANSAQTFAVIAADLPTNQNGTAIVAGELTKLDTSAYAEGVALYLSPTTAGTFTTTKPSAPNHLVYVATVVRSHQNQGVIEVRIQNGYELDELHNVAIATPTNGQGLIYDSATSLWKNQAIPTPDLSAYLAKADNLSGLASASTARTNLGLGTMAVETASNYATLNSPTFTGTVLAPTPVPIAAGDVVATCGWVKGFGYLVSSDLTPYLTSATAASTYQTISGMSSYLTTSTAASTYLTQSNAASTYQTQSGMSSYAPLASPTFTGDPKAPTPATSDNDTSIATTAFVNAYCPAASTSTAGKVQLATEAQAIAASSDTLAITPYGARLTALNIQVKDFTNRIFSYSGSGGGGLLNLNNGRDLFDINAGNTTASGAYVFLSQPIEGLYNTTTVSNKLDWSKPFEIRGRINPGPGAQTSSNAVWRLYLGGGPTATLGDPTFKSIGIKLAGGGQVQLMVHNGTTLTTVNTGYTQSNFIWFDFILKSDGAGNATLTINGTNTATSSAAPSSGTQGTNNCLYVITENIGIITGGNRLYGTGIRGYFAN